MIIDFEHHYIPAELGRRFGIDPAGKDAIKAGDATVHAQLFDLEAQLRDMRTRVSSALKARIGNALRTTNNANSQSVNRAIRTILIPPLSFGRYAEAPCMTCCTSLSSSS